MTDLCPNCGSKVTFAQPTDDRAAARNDENPVWSCIPCGRSGDTLELEAAEREAPDVSEITDMIAGLTSLAAWVLTHPAANPNLGRLVEGDTRLLWCTYDADRFPDFVRMLMDGAAIGAVTKAVDDNWQKVTRHFGGGVTLQLFIPRERVCTRRVVGTETVEVADPDAPTVTVEREIVEWDCAPVLAQLDAVKA